MLLITYVSKIKKVLVCLFFFVKEDEVDSG